jgi:iron complex transport system substrate-binding protein
MSGPDRIIRGRKRRQGGALALLFLLLLGCRGSVEPVKKERKGSEPGIARIVSMVPSATEILFSLGAGAGVVGVCDQCRWPKETQGLPKLGSYLNPSTEMILELEPDLVLLYRTQTQLAAALKERGIEVLQILTENLDDLYGAVKEIGRAVGREEEAAGLVADMKAGLAEVEKKAKAKGRVKTVLVVDRMGFGLQRLFVAAGRSYMSQLVEKAGGDNCFKSMDARYPMVSLEAVAACRPDVIIDIRPEGEVTQEGKKQGMALWKASGVVYPDGPVKKVEVIGPDPLTVPGPRAARSAEILHELLFGGS